MPRVKSDKSDCMVLVSIYCVYIAIQNRNVVRPGQGSRIPAHDKRDPWGRGWDVILIQIWRLRSPHKIVLNVETKQAFRLRSASLYYWLIRDDFQDDMDNTSIVSAIKTDHAVLQFNSVGKQPTRQHSLVKFSHVSNKSFL